MRGHYHHVVIRRVPLVVQPIRIGIVGHHGREQLGEVRCPKMRHIRRSLQGRPPGTIACVVLPEVNGRNRQPVPPAVNRPFSRRSPAVPHRSKHWRARRHVVLRPVINVIIERQRAELVLNPLLQNKRIYTGICHADRIVAYIKLCWFWWINQKLGGELIESVGKTHSDLPLYPLPITDGQDFIGIRKIRPHPDLVLSVAVMRKWN